MVDIRGLKQSLRREMMHARKLIGDGAYRERSDRLVHRLLALPEIQQADRVHAFWPIIRNREVDIRPLLLMLHEKGRQIVLPRVVSFDSWQEGVARLEHRLFSGETNLSANRWDVYEPYAGDIVPVSSLDAIIVPALAIDRLGIRLGYGKGYYDEFLSLVDAPTICPVFDEFFVEKLPEDEHDIPVDIIVSETEILRTA